MSNTSPEIEVIAKPGQHKAWNKAYSAHQKILTPTGCKTETRVGNIPVSHTFKLHVRGTESTVQDVIRTYQENGLSARALVF